MKTIHKTLIKQSVATFGFGFAASAVLFVGTNIGIAVGLFIGLLYGFFVFFNKAYATYEQICKDPARTIYD